MINLNLNFNQSISYHSRSQCARVITEDWVEQNMYCPRCGNNHIQHFPNNCPVADFFCPACRNQYELKSKKGNFGNKIVDGAYKTMIERITSNSNPDFFFMSYSEVGPNVQNLIVVPKYFFVPGIIEKRPPLASTARRANWVGCTILFTEIPIQGRISIINNGVVQEKYSVVALLNRAKALETNDLSSRGWLLDVLSCVNAIPEMEFSSKEIYKFENELKLKHPENTHICAKIRQQLQILRDKGFLEFLSPGHYRKKEFKSE